MRTTNSRKIIAFAGRKNAGKTTIANYLAEAMGATKMAFADSLKDLCCQMLSINREELEAMKNSAEIISTDPSWIQIISDETGIEMQTIKDEWNDGKRWEEKEFNGIRELMQFIGTGIIRTHKPTWHVGRLCKAIRTLPKNVMVIVDDVRFMNEVEALEKMGGEVFFVIRPYNISNISNHISERSLRYDDFKLRRIISNDGSLIDLHDRVKNYINNGKFYSEQEIAETNKWWSINYLMDYEDLIADLYPSNDPQAALKRCLNPFVLEDVKIFANCVFD